MIHFMKRIITQASYFSREIKTLLKKRRLLLKDFEGFKEELAKNPELGDLIIGTAGCRKVRMKSSSKGKRGGFRICYYDMTENNKLYLLFVYAKNDKENLTSEEKDILKELVVMLKKEASIK
jgi:hypothetical protein